jgi:hypothetical protein
MVDGNMINNNNLPKDDLWDIQRLFVHLNGEKGIVHIKEGKLTVESRSWQTVEQKKITLQKIKEIVQNWDIFTDLKLSDTYIDQYISSDLTIRAEDIRRLYKNVIRRHLDKFEKDSYASAAVGNSDFDRIVLKKDEKNSNRVIAESSSWIFSIFGESQLSVKIVNLFDRIFGNKENEKVRQDFLETLTHQWGEHRVTRILERHDINLKNDSRSLRVQDIRKVYASLVQLKEDDIKESFEEYKKYRKDSDDSTIPLRLKEKFDNNPNLKDVFSESDLDLYFEELSGDQITDLIKTISLDRKEIELCLLGNRIEGVVVGHRGFFDIYRFFHSDLYEDTEIAQVYQEMLEPENQQYDNKKIADLYFFEMWTKLLVKKEGSQFVPNDLLGRVVPAPNGEFYKISNITNKWGKFVLFLEPISEKGKQAGEGLIIDCSTAWSWSSSKNLSSMWQNLNPLAPPGYVNGTDFSEEIKFINDHKKVTITGHSLGGSFAQRTLVEYAKSLKEGDESKTTDISLITFDSPGIKKEDDLVLKDNKLLAALNIEVEHYFSYGDVVPFSGWMHLGAFSSSEKLKVRPYFLHAEGITTPETQIHPHTAYWFRYYNKLKNLNAKVLKADDLANFGKLHSPFWEGRENNPWGIDFRAIVIDPVRRLAGIAAAPIMYPIVWIHETSIEYGFNLKNILAKINRFFFSSIIPTKVPSEL